MGIRFLCESHRQQLQRSEAVAMQRWEEWMEAGREAYAQREWLPALRYLGCCFELSELMLATTNQSLLHNLDRHMLSGHYLAECFARCGDTDLQQHCLLAVHHRLLQTLRSPAGQGLALRQNVEISLQMLERYYRRANRLDELSHCQRESQRLLRSHCH
ncbi:hypothetical protein [Spongiibacter sp.]|uniref:hypothetical protein n=1 Tax=Spongiibacter sp. TaxID=2024860 RepID=UPI00356A7E33